MRPSCFSLVAGLENVHKKSRICDWNCGEKTFNYYFCYSEKEFQSAIKLRFATFAQASTRLSIHFPLQREIFISFFAGGLGVHAIRFRSNWNIERFEHRLWKGLMWELSNYLLNFFQFLNLKLFNKAEMKYYINYKFAPRNRCSRKSPVDNDWKLGEVVNYFSIIDSVLILHKLLRIPCRK